MRSEEDKCEQYTQEYNCSNDHSRYPFYNLRYETLATVVVYVSRTYEEP